MNSLRWAIGDVEIVRLMELEAGDLIQGIIVGATPENIQAIDWLQPYFADASGRLKILVQGFLIRSDGKVILIDTCNGNDKQRTDVPEWGNLKIDFLSQLAAEDVTPEDVNIVACTHLHMDHVGWNTRFENGRWVPTFPNARHLFVRKEYEYWQGMPPKEIADDKAAFRDSIQPIMDADLAELVDVYHRIDRNISFFPTPGHTPAHVSVRIESKGEQAVISGDVLHHPCQIAHPDWGTEADSLPQEATVTRKQFLEDLAKTKALLIGSHFADPVAGRVVYAKDNFRFNV